MRYDLRPATDADYDFLYELKKTCLKDYIVATWGPWDEEFHREYFDAHFDPAASRIIGVGGREVGELSLIEREDDVYVSGIYILPEYQGRGLGTAVIGDVIGEARIRGRPVSLRVLKVNPARRLYERLGFETVGETDTHFQMRTRQPVR